LIPVWFALIAHCQSLPNQIPGLEMWLKADAGIVLNGNYVAEWNDQSGNGHHATSPFDVIRPVLQNASLNGLPAVSFDGIEDFLSYPDVSNLRTVFWVMRESPDASGWPLRPLLGFSGGVPFHRGAAEELYDATNSAAQVRNGVTRLNFQPINGTLTVMPVTYSILSLVTTGPVTVNTLTMELGIYGRTWWGEMAEVIIYNTPLSDVEVLQVETYLAEKYGPAFIAMDDVSVDDGFCETTLCASPGFVSYQWQDGPQTACRPVNAPGSYVVTLTDTFGREILDTVNVTYPGYAPASALTLCFGDNYIWDTGLNEAQYDFLWDDNSTGASRVLNSAGFYSVIITDSNGCSRTLETTVSVDDFSQVFSLGGDASLCSGNSLHLVPEPEAGLTYFWNTSAQTPQIVVNESGSYWVEAINANGCVLRDTVEVNIVGVAPEIAFTATGRCEDGTTSLSAELISPGNATSWIWNFDDGQTASGQLVLHTFDEPGNALVELQVVTSDGCSNEVSEVVYIYQKPSVAFSTDQLCVNLPVVFISQSSSAESEIVATNWTINESFFSGNSANVQFADLGFKPVLLEVTDANNCIAGISGFVEVKAAPAVSFATTGNCEGSLTQFYESVDEISFGGANYYQWSFGDNTGSMLPNPSHYFSEPGNYSVNLLVSGANGCVADSSIVVVVYAEPIADFIISNACQGLPYVFNESSVAQPGDQVVAWNWVIGDGIFSSVENPEIVFDQTGLVPVELQVSTLHGCLNAVMQQIPVWPQPTASFTFSPEIGEAPFEVQFTLTTTEAASAHWFFGDTHESDELNPLHVFTLNGTAYTQVIVKNDAGCADTAATIITIAEPILDIALQDVQWLAVDGVADMTANISNTGNIEVNEILFTWQIGNDAPVMEEWTGSLKPGESLQYDFVSKPNFAGSQFPYICVNAETSPMEHTEVNLTDNMICKPTASTGLEVFPPYPNPGDDRMFIRFMTPVAGDLEMLVYDAKGNVVMEIQDDAVPKGFHQYFIDITTLPNGHYKLLLQMNDLKGAVSFMKVKR
jgi:PKD repeat protein